MGNKRVYNRIMFGCFAVFDLIISVALSYSLGIKGFLLPTLLVTTAYLVVEVTFDLITHWLDGRDQTVRTRRRW